jgi:hypothetical protein
MPIHIAELLNPRTTYAIVTDGAVKAQDIIRALTGITHKYTVGDHMDGGALLTVGTFDEGELGLSLGLNGVRRVLFYDWTMGVGADGLRQRHAVLRDHEHRGAASQFGDDTAVVYICNGRFEPTFTRAFPTSVLFVPEVALTLRRDPNDGLQMVLESVHRKDGQPSISYYYDDGVLRARNPQ